MLSPFDIQYHLQEMAGLISTARTRYHQVVLVADVHFFDKQQELFNQVNVAGAVKKRPDPLSLQAVTGVGKGG